MSKHLLLVLAVLLNGSRVCFMNRRSWSSRCLNISFSFVRSTAVRRGSFPSNRNHRRTSTSIWWIDVRTRCRVTWIQNHKWRSHTLFPRRWSQSSWCKKKKGNRRFSYSFSYICFFFFFLVVFFPNRLPYSILLYSILFCKKFYLVRFQNRTMM